jgi:hypothetical protein
MSGEEDRRFHELARKTLLDALEVLRPLHEALILAGAQAIYVQLGADTISVAATTRDADLVLIPNQLKEPPPALHKAMESIKFVLVENKPGHWQQPEIPEDKFIPTIDFMVPKGLLPPENKSRRSAHIGEAHGDNSAQIAPGLEGAVVDFETHEIKALEEGDQRSFSIRVAGPGALLVAKLHKIYERVEELEKAKKDKAKNPNKSVREHRLRDKDALDVFRLLQGFALDDLAARVKKLISDARSQKVTERALGYLPKLFKHPGEGLNMLRRGHPPMESDEWQILSARCEALVDDLLKASETKGVNT